ncbi:MAG: hypothetical protein JO104_10125, partial [Candidatus Eremiobacteraeota bacterium]|nr:hypothetical protein [Candidatus Eremiobacteraeota bacterium]
MSWIGAKTQGSSAVCSHAQTRRHGDEFETVVRAKGTAANAVVENISALECRFRSTALFEVNLPVEFEVQLPGQPVLSVRGRVVSRTTVHPRFVYTVALDRMTDRETDDLATSLAHSHRTNARTRMRDISTLGEMPVPQGLRQRQRISAEFSMQYRTSKDGFKAAKAANLSTGGLLMICDEML